MFWENYLWSLKKWIQVCSLDCLLKRCDKGRMAILFYWMILHHFLIIVRRDYLLPMYSPLICTKELHGSTFHEIYIICDWIIFPYSSVTECIPKSECLLEIFRVFVMFLLKLKFFFFIKGVFCNFMNKLNITF